MNERSLFLAGSARSVPRAGAHHLGNAHVPGEHAALLMLTLPVSTAFLAFVFLGERMTAIRWISFSLAIVGVLLCSDIDFRSLNFGRGYLYGNACSDLREHAGKRFL
jgi:drug/metabolite transporter (DMT)-like permease